MDSVDLAILRPLRFELAIVGSICLSRMRSLGQWPELTGFKTSKHLLQEVCLKIVLQVDQKPPSCNLIHYIESAVLRKSFSFC